MEKISVIIPVYNTKAYLEKCVHSVLVQTLKPHEVILVDDGSTDGSPALCDQLMHEYPETVRVIHQKNAGLSAARNRGIDTAEGTYLSFVDSDDYLEPDAYAFLLHNMKKADADISIGELIVEQPDGRMYRHITEDITLCWNTEEALIQLCSYRYLHVSSCTALYKKTLFEGIRFPVGKLCEDYYTQHKVFAKSRKTIYSSKVFYHYYQRPQSISREKGNVSLAPLEAAEERLAFYRSYFPRIAWASEADVVIAHMSVYNSYVRKQIPCEAALLKRLRQTSRKYLASVLFKSRIPIIKKFQVFLFCFALWPYRFVIARSEHR